MALVLVQHLSPDHKSILGDLVKRYTKMPVFEVEDGMKVRPGSIYIIPPNRDMAFLNGRLQLLKPAEPRGLRLPIDFFFRSLAVDQHERAICIVLSGTGSDGTLGVRAVKGEGGMAMAQSPESTEHDGMPRSAIATGLVDYVLPPAEMLARLISYLAHAFGLRQTRHPVSTRVAEDALSKICVTLRAGIGHDFSQYKKNTLQRRIERRMAIGQIERMDLYHRFLEENPAEVEALFRDLLIGVTHFFRDPEAFEALQNKVVPDLFQQRGPGEAIRVWVCGCSTGEEAYSLAILLHEHLESLKQACKVQIFATDIDPRAIETARAGKFPASIAADVSAERLARFFFKKVGGDHYQIHKSIRDDIVFSEQDVITNPPFSRLDLVSCRNLLIYLNSDLQKRLIPLFHYALRPGGVLFLGSSETIGEPGSWFTVLDRKWKIYRRGESLFPTDRFLPTTTRLPLPAAARTRPRHKPVGEAPTDLLTVTRDALLAHLSQTAILVDGQGQILHIHGRTGKYLEPPVGDAQSDILPMAREGLRQALTTALHKATTQHQPMRYSGLRIRTNGDFITADLTVRPVPDGEHGEFPSNQFLVVLEEVVKVDAPKASAAENSDGDDGEASGKVAALKEELRAKDEYLQATLEEMETSNEELRSTNEEMQAINEELQSTNEELETSKEELQSVNEELATVNAELQAKVAELSRANNDMNNLLAGTGVGTIFVDHDLCISRFTPSVTRVINLIRTDIGRPVGHIVSNLRSYNRLVEDVRAVLDDLIPRETEVQSKEGAWFLLRIQPYRTLDNVIEGAVITFVETTERKKMQAALLEAERRSRPDGPPLEEEMP